MFRSSIYVLFCYEVIAFFTILNRIGNIHVATLHWFVSNCKLMEWVAYKFLLIGIRIGFKVTNSHSLRPRLAIMCCTGIGKRVWTESVFSVFPFSLKLSYIRAKENSYCQNWGSNINSQKRSVNSKWWCFPFLMCWRF